MKQLSSEKRAIIVHLHQKGKSQRAFAEEVGCPKTTVANTIKRWKERGDFKEREGRGRKSCIHPEMSESWYGYQVSTGD